jgi:hypothetical protein
MKKILIWIIGLLFILLSGYLMIRSFFAAVDEMSKTVDNISVAGLGGALICSVGTSFCVILHLIILFSLKYLKRAELSIGDLLISRGNTGGIKVIKIIGYLFIGLYLYEIIRIAIHSNGIGDIYELFAMAFAITVTCSFMIWLSAISKYRTEKRKPLYIIVVVCLLIFGPFLLSPAIGWVIMPR